MKLRTRVLIALAVVPVMTAAEFSIHSRAVRAVADPPIRSQPRAAQALGRLPLRFEANNGQMEPAVRYLARGPQYSVLLTDTDAVIRLPGDGGTVTMSLAGGSDRPRIVPGAKREEVSNYLLGDDPRCWHMGVPSYDSVRYERVYAGIDLVYYATDRQLEYDFLVSPHADPRRIRMVFGAPGGIRVDAAGDLILGRADSPIRFRKPTAYQRRGGARRPVDVRYAVDEQTGAAGFRLGAYDPAAPLVIDPILNYSTYLGGSGSDFAYGIAVDASGNVYVTGSTDSLNFPTTAGALSSVYNGVDFDIPPGGDVFVAKLNASGALVYSTYVGGTKSERGLAIAVDAAGNAYVAGATSSTDFPTTKGSRQPKWGNFPFQSNGDAFVFKLNPAGSAFVYSTYLSGTSLTVANGIAVDASGAAYVTGQSSFNFLTPNPLVLQPTAGNTSADAFVAKLTPDGAALSYATLVGGTDSENARGVALDALGSAYIVGETFSTNFPTRNPAQAVLGGGADLFVTKLSPSGTSVYSTYLGGARGESAGGIAVDGSGSAYIVGSTDSTNYPITAGAFQTALKGFVNAIVTKLDPTGALSYSTYLGGGQFENVAGNGLGTAGAIAVDTSGNAVVVGQTSSSDFPLKHAFQTTNSLGGEIFVTRINATGTGILYSTFLGGSATDLATAVALDAAGSAYVAGSTTSTDFPVKSALQATNRGQRNVVVAKLDPHDPPTMSLDRTGLVFAATVAKVFPSFGFTTGPQQVRLTQSGTGTVTWTAASNQPYVVVSPTAGTGSATLTVSIVSHALDFISTAPQITFTFSGAANNPGPINVTVQTILGVGTSSAPSGSFDTPVDGVTGVAGSIPVTGWAIDDLQVSRVRILRDPVAGEASTPIYIGDAVFVDGARPDVQALYPGSPLNSRAGWGYLMLTNFLPNLGNGTFKLYAYADDVDGHTTLLDTKTITCSNNTSTAPFGALDTPGQGGVVSGTAYNNFGWVLSPGTRRADPPGGGTVNVLIDGVNVGSPAAWSPRADITALFPLAQFSGANNAVGVYTFDATTLANGIHTIAWVVTANAGGTSGIGSRYFAVSNGAALTEGGSYRLKAEVTGVPETGGLFSPFARLPPSGGRITGRRGFDPATPYRTYTADAGRFTIQAEEIDRIELRLEPGVTGALRTPSGLAALPTGSHLDAESGTFTWMPGVGFLGTYDFVFGAHDVRIVLNPKGSNRVGTQVVIDAPAPGRANAASLFVGGWAADLDSAVDSGVDVVHVWAYPINAAGTYDAPILLGAATYGGARPDVAAVYGERFTNSGYGLTVSSLTPGMYDIAVFAYSTLLNRFAPAKIVRVVTR